MKYELQIDSARPGDGFTYRIFLLRDGKRIADTFTATRWGARLWAKRVARADQRERFHARENVTV